MHLPKEESVVQDLCEAFENASVPLAQRLSDELAHEGHPLGGHCGARGMVDIEDVYESIGALGRYLP